MSTVKEITRAFRSLSEEKKERLILDVCGYSKEMKMFLESLLLRKIDEDAFIIEMEKETIDKVYRQGMPKTPNGKTIQTLLSKAKKIGVSNATMLELEKLACRGFIEFLNEYGGGPDSFDALAAKHFEAYLMLVRDEEEENRHRIFGEVREYLLDKRNMYRDDLDAIFTEVTGIKI